MSNARRNWVLFLSAGVFLGITSGMYDSTFNNYLSDVFSMSASTRGWLEFPREFPGVSIALVSMLLGFLPETRMAALAVAVWALGLAGLAFFTSGFSVLVVWMMLWSLGTHLYLPLSQAIGVSVAEHDRVGKRLGDFAGANTAAIIAGAGFVMVGSRFFGVSYQVIFGLAAFFAVFAALAFFLMRIRSARSDASDAGDTGPSLAPGPGLRSGKRLVLKRKYGLFYALSVLYGARKQVFLTFGPWVLIKVFEQPASTIALLWIISSALGIAFKPMLGRLVDALGERKILMAEAMALVLVCLGYCTGGTARPLGINIGLYLACACFVVDQLLVAVGIARTTYLNKIADTPADLTPTLAMGISMDHVVSMSVPTLGGLLWQAAGYRYVFFAAACVALMNLFIASKIRIHEEIGTHEGAESGSPGGYLLVSHTTTNKPVP
ncbi:MAG TPA: MFS transporter [Firmicutes bacterium]|nr:MFS transporter [Bacillota bacterium]